MSTRYINAMDLRLALFSRRIGHPHWAALSNGFHTYGCTNREMAAPYCHPHPPLFLPILPCTLDERLLDKVRMSRGAKEIKAIWDLGYRQLLAENKQRRDRVAK